MAKRHGPRTPVVLIVLDGWGFRPGQMGNAIELGRTPTWHRLWAKAPRTLLNASGLSVGLPEGQIGNSEVGHLNLGAGRVVPQDIVRISQAIDSGAFFHIPALVELCGELRRTGRTLHLLGLIGDVGEPAPDPVSAVRQAYEAGETDEFVKPRIVAGTPRIRDGDGVFCVNFRADRMRQIVRALALEGFDAFDTGRRPRVRLVTMTQYDETFPFPVAFGPAVLSRIVAQVLAERGKTMFRTAETEKYAHVTYFFNCGVETPYPGEERVLVPSQQVPTYDLMPEMSAPGVTDVLCKAIEAKQHDFILCNYANGDMVGHSGVLSAAVKAVEVVDGCLARALGSAERAGATLLVTADHGNCELMIDPTTDGPHTAHTTNPVPLLIVGDDAKGPLRHGGALCDVGPTLLHMLDVEPPQEMTGRDLREVD